MPSQPMQKCGLSSLAQVDLDSAHQAWLAQAAARCAGPRPWQMNKLHQLRAFLALAQLSGRLTLVKVDLESDLRVLVAMRCPVACLSAPSQSVATVLPFVLLGIAVPEAAVRSPHPGSSFACIFEPRHVYHPNISPDGALCLGPTLPAGISLKEIVLLSFGALTFQTVKAELDVRNPALSLNPDAAQFWQQPANLARLPLTSESFIP